MTSRHQSNGALTIDISGQLEEAIKPLRETLDRLAASAPGTTPQAEILTEDQAVEVLIDLPALSAPAHLAAALYRAGYALCRRPGTDAHRFGTLHSPSALDSPGATPRDWFAPGRED